MATGRLRRRAGRRGPPRGRGRGREPEPAELRLRVEEAGWAAPLVFLGVYVALALAPVPKNAASAVAGLLFGLVQGVAVVLTAALLGALLAFALGRTLGRGAVEQLASPRLKGLDEGLTGVRLRDYTIGTAVGIVPGTVAYVTLGTYGATPGAWPFVLSVAALVGLSAGGVLVARRRRASQQDD